jgi:hypothetical protein
VLCGAVAEVFTALEVRRKVCVAPLGLRALKVEIVSMCAGRLSCAPGWMRRRSHDEMEGLYRAERRTGRTIPSPHRVVARLNCCQRRPRRMSKVPL